MAEITKLAIDRKRWYRGRAGSLLVNEDQEMCCLGFLGVACGADPLSSHWGGSSGGILLKGLPTRSQEFWPRWLFTHVANANFSDVACQLAHVNDNRGIDDVAREAEIIRIMGEHGVTVEFV